jgi:hypothetical protein
MAEIENSKNNLIHLGNGTPPVAGLSMTNIVQKLF